MAVNLQALEEEMCTALEDVLSAIGVFEEEER